MDVSKNSGTPKWMVYNGNQSLLKWMIWGYHYFWKHPYTYLNWAVVKFLENPYFQLVWDEHGKLHCRHDDGHFVIHCPHWTKAQHQTASIYSTACHSWISKFTCGNLVRAVGSQLPNVLSSQLSSMNALTHPRFKIAFKMLKKQSNAPSRHFILSICRLMHNWRNRSLHHLHTWWHDWQVRGQKQKHRGPNIYNRIQQEIIDL